MANDHEVYVVPLGVAAALPDAQHANSYLAVVRQGRYWLVDCADNPIGRLQQANLNPLAVRGVIITHFHPDHVYGLPAYLLGLCLLALQDAHVWEKPLPIYARPEALEQVQALLALFDSQGWIKELPLVYREVAAQFGALVAEDEDFLITAAPTYHSIPSLAVRFEIPGTERVMVYSSDTMPTSKVEQLAAGVPLLLHEATGSGYGHTSPENAGALARRAAVGRLVLIHYHVPLSPTASIVAAAQETFGGPVEMAHEFTQYPF